MLLICSFLNTAVYQLPTLCLLLVVSVYEIGLLSRTDNTLSLDRIGNKHKDGISGEFYAVFYDIG